MVERPICLHFCAFRAAGSRLAYTHVHILDGNPGKVTGLGHDDNTDNEDKGHTTISDGDGVRIQAEDEKSMALRKVRELGTAYFHPAGADGECPEGFTRLRCKCAGKNGPEDVWVCYTMDHDVFEGWYDAHRWTNHAGDYAHPFTQAKYAPDVLACGSSIVLGQYEIANEQSCTGFGGPGDGENALIKEARTELQQAMDKIVCGAGCTISKTETFRGWICGPSRSGKVLTAEAIVQWTIKCA